MDAIALIVPFVESWYFSEVVEGAARRIRAADLGTALVLLQPDTEKTTDEIAAVLERDDIVGAVILDFDFSEEDAKRLVDIGKPLAGIGGKVPYLPTVMIDDTLAARIATEHLIAAGHRAIAHVGGQLPRQMDFLVHSRRLKGYVDAMTDAGLESYCQFEPAEFSIDEGARAVHRVLADPARRPTAIFAISDELAYGMVAEAGRMGLRVPEDLSIIGIDDHAMSHALGLSTVRQVPRDMAEIAVELVLDQIDGADRELLAGPHLQPVSLVQRATVGPPRAGEVRPHRESGGSGPDAARLGNALSAGDGDAAGNPTAKDAETRKPRRRLFSRGG